MSVLTAFLFYFLVEGPLAQVERLIFKGPKAVVNHGKTHEEGEREVEARKEGGEEAMKEKGGRERSEGGVVVAVAVSDAASEDSTVVMMKAVQ